LADAAQQGDEADGRLRRPQLIAHPLDGVNREVEVHVAGDYEATVKPSYIDLRSIYVGAAALKDEHLTPGTITVLIEDDPEFSVEGTLNAQGLLSGMAKLYSKLPLPDGTKIAFAVQADGSIIVRSPKPPAVPPAPGAGAAEAPKTVFEVKHLKHIHIEAFRPENLDNWEPETETDIYLAFGVLQDFTDFQYCCGASKALLTKLGASYEEAAKPDAILIDRKSDQYLMAEWKKHSADFKVNHKPDDVDVLVCWHDNELDKKKLPPRVVALHSVAKKAAEAKLGVE
jgi:hypothetical protein